MWEVDCCELENAGHHGSKPRGYGLIASALFAAARFSLHNPHTTLSITNTRLLLPCYHSLAWGGSGAEGLIQLITMKNVIDLRKKKSNLYDYVVGSLAVGLFFASIFGWEVALNQPNCTAINGHTITCQ